MYASQVYRSEPVLRCPNHSAAVDSSLGGRAGAPPSHFVRSDHASAQYVVNSSTGHHSVIVPYEPPGNSLKLIVFVQQCSISRFVEINVWQLKFTNKTLVPTHNMFWVFFCFLYSSSKLQRSRLTVVLKLA